MNKKLIYIITLLFVPNCLAYIDPGSGGYLAVSLWSSFWAWLVAACAIMAGVIKVYYHKIILYIKQKRR